MPRPAPQIDSSDEPAAALELRFTCFSLLLAAAILLHQIHEAGLEPLHAGTLILDLTALWAMLRPASVSRFVALAAAQVAVCAEQMPFVWNHWMFLALADVSVLACAADIALRNGGRVRGDELYAAAAPALRLALVLLYGFTALAKLNHAYFDPTTSCATALYARLTTFLPFLPSGRWTETGAIWVSVAIELALPAMLVVPQTRVAGLLLGGAFHLLLGINDNYDFSAVLLPFYLLFVPAGLWPRDGRLASGRLRTTAVRLAQHRFIFPLLAAPLVAVLAAGEIPAFGRVRLHAHLLRGGKILWLVLCAALLAALIAALRSRSGTQDRESIFRPLHPVALVGPLLIALAGLTPYVGLNTERAFAMFSNLRTEGDQWNHLLVPRRLRLFTFQDRLYEIEASSDPALQEIAAQGSALVPFELRRRLSLNPDAAVTYVVDGRRTALQRAGDDAELSSPLPSLLARLLWFHPVAPGGACAH